MRHHENQTQKEQPMVSRLALRSGVVGCLETAADDECKHVSRTKNNPARHLSLVIYRTSSSREVGDLLRLLNQIPQFILSARRVPRLHVLAAS